MRFRHHVLNVSYMVCLTKPENIKGKGYCDRELSALKATVIHWQKMLATFVNVSGFAFANAWQAQSGFAFSRVSSGCDCHLYYWYLLVYSFVSVSIDKNQTKFQLFQSL